METYLLETGKFRLFFGWFFRLKYYKDIATLLRFFEDWEMCQRQLGVTIHEGFHPYDVYCTLINQWDYPRFEKAMRICLYAGLIEMVEVNRFKVKSFESVQ